MTKYLLFMSKYFKSFANNSRNSGLTLVEVLLSITILGVLAVLVAGVFGNGFAFINFAGDLNRAGYHAALVTENAIGGLNVMQVGSDAKIRGPSGEERIEDITVSAPQAKTVTIDFPARSISVSGYERRVTSHGKNNHVTIEVFIPQ